MVTGEKQEVESNITYVWGGQRGYDNEDYILLGPERVAVRNSRTPSFFLQSSITDDANVIEHILLEKPTILEHISNEITLSVMHAIVDNFRLFARNVPARYYYTYQDQ